MKKINKTILHWFFFVAPLFLYATDYTIGSVDEFNELNLSAGDTVTWENGTYSSDERIEFFGNGTSNNPIILKAETPGGVVFTGGLKIDIAGNYLVVDGFYWNGGYGASNFIQFRNGTTYAQNCTIQNCAINGLEAEPDDAAEAAADGSIIKHRWIVLYGNYNNVLNCSFMNKDTAGALILAEYEYNAEEDRCTEVGHTIANNYFYNYEKQDRSLSNAGDSETIRIGTSEFQNVNSQALVTGNYFVEADGELEIITNKSANNTYTNNTFRRCRGSLVMRHGANATVTENYFLGENTQGTGGIRIADSDHTITNNYIQDCISTFDEIVILWNNGLTFVGGNTSSVSNCSSTSVSNAYQDVENITFSNNTFVNSNSPFYFNASRDGADNVFGTIANNLIYFDNGNDNISDVIGGSYSEIGNTLTFSNNVYDGTALGESVGGFSSANLSTNNNGEIYTISGANNVGASISNAPITDSMVGNGIGACFLGAEGNSQSDCDGTVIDPPKNDSLTVSSIDDFEADGGSQSVTVSANIDWTVSESSPWVSINNTSDSGNGNFTITVSENTSTNDRSATVTVSGNDITRSITVSQEGTSVPDTGLDPNRPPSENFDLTDFNINVPIDRGRTINTGISTNIQRYELNDGYEAKDVDGRDYFYTGADGGMVFKNYPKDAPKTSVNTSYSRTELRGIFTNDTITQQAKNNWYFSSSDDIPSDAGGVDGVLTATLAVNHVTIDGNSNHKGRVIIGQIHGSENEPCRLYYHKLPEHNRGAIYVVHEENDKDETWYNIIGNYIEHGDDSGDLNDDIEESSDGIELDEQFSYKIEVIGNDQWVTISRPGKADITQYIDMANSDYEDDYMYFKAGAYSQNNSTDLDDDYDQVTFYALSQTNDGTTTDPTESLTVSSIDDFKADGDSQTVNVTANVDWTVSENSSWISLNTTSGSDNGSFTITTNENTSTNDRSATITVTGSDITRSISVSQEGAEEEDTEETDNLALNGNASQSTTAFGGLASRAIDGDTNGNYFDDSVTHTSATTGSWWQVELDAQTNIGDIIIYNRIDNCCIDRLADFTVFVYDSNGNEVYSQTITEAPTPSVTINADGALGNTVRIVTNLNDTALSLAEVKVYAGEGTNTCSEGNNLSLNASIASFSDQENTTNSASNLIDDNDNNRWSAETFPQNVVIDLGDTYNVNEINLSPYKDRAYQFLVEGSTSSATSGFSTLTDATGNTNGGNNINRTFDSQSVQYVRLTITGASGYDGLWSSIEEFEIICAGGDTTTNPTESLTVSSVNDFDADGDSQTVNVTANVDWTVSESSSWISVNNTNGSNNGSFTITTSENTSTNDRSATVTVTGGDISRSITVSQEGAEDTDGSTPSESCSEGNNLSLIGSIVDFSTEENSTNTVANIIDDSTGNRWSAEGFPQFATIDLGDNYNVNEVNLVSHKDRDYQFIVEGSTSSATSGFSTLVDASDNTDEGTINETFSAQTVRYVKLTITGANSYSGEWSSIEEFEIICAGDSDGNGTDNLTVSSINNFDTEGNSQTVNVTANVDWTVSESSSWISLNTTNGSNNGSFTITASENTSDNDRTTTVTVTGSNISRTINIRQEGTATIDTGLNPNVPPSENFDLTNWNINVPIDRDGDSGISTTIEREEFSDGYELIDEDGRDYFFTGADGGMVFRNYPKGAPKTSSGTSYSRNELREILTDDRSASKPENNWYLSNSDDLDSDAGGVDGVLAATLAVNHLTVDGIQLHQGRIIIGQVHGSDNEPSRIYYHKLPEHTKGALYVAHEDNNGDELWYNVFGNFINDGGSSHLLNDNIQEPEVGIELNEKFSYRIEVIATDLWVTISKEGEEDIVKYFDMAESDYENDYLYFKAGVYSQNSTTDLDDDYDQVTFYALSQSHDRNTGAKSILENLNENVTVYPNPFINSININFTNNTIVPVAKVRITDLSSKVISTTSVISQQQEIQITGDYSTGVYFIQLLDVNDNIIAIKKVISKQ